MDKTPLIFIIDLHCESDVIEERFIVERLLDIIKEYKSEHPKLYKTLKKLKSEEQSDDVITSDVSLTLDSINFKEYVNSQEYIMQINIFKEKIKTTLDVLRAKVRKGISNGTFGFGDEIIYYHEVTNNFVKQPDKILVTTAVTSTKGLYSLHHSLFEVLK